VTLLVARPLPTGPLPKLHKRLWEAPPPHVAYVEQRAGVGEVRVQRWNGTAWQRVGAVLNDVANESGLMPYLVGVGTVPYVAFREPATNSTIRVKRFP